MVPAVVHGQSKLLILNYCIRFIENNLVAVIPR